MAANPGAGEAGDRIEALLEEVRGMVSPPAWSRVEELLRAVLELHRTGLAQTLALLDEEGAEGARIAARLSADPLVVGLLLLHDLHPDDLETRIRAALDRVRPYLDSHGGDVEIAELDPARGALRLRLKGSCDGCPSSALTVKLAVEGAIRELAPDLDAIEVENVTPEPSRANGSGHGDSRQVSRSEPKASEGSQWVRIAAPAGDAPGTPEVREVDGARLLLCRVDGRLYAYRDGCPDCGSGLGDGALADGVLACPRCRSRYDVRRAGRVLDDRDLQLGPVPLLERDTGVDVAVAEVAR